MNNIAIIKKWVQAFLLSVFVIAATNNLSSADNSIPEAEIRHSLIASKYIASLEIAVEEYKKIADNGGWPTLASGPSIKEGMEDERIPTIRHILSIMGDYKTTGNEDSKTLDSELIEAIKSFQIRHGLDTDGAIGKKTQLAMAIPVEMRIAQMQASIEQMKKMPDLGERYVLVNVPGYYLKAMDKDSTAINSRIIVGTPKNSTPLFSRPITDVSFNPAWHVPYNIARNEMMKKLRDDPEYFNKGNFVVKDREGEVINVNEINWEEHDGENYKFVQQSGDKNALGKVKFNLPDTNNIYLHSTGSPKLFNKAQRALSHGCIRVEMARELAFFVMNGMNGWDDDRISKLYDSSTTKMLKVNPLPVYLAYWTSWVDEASKKPYFYPDIYGHDKKRVAEIFAEMKRPESEGVKVAMK